MDDENSMKVMYEARRQARGAEPPRKTHAWRRRLIVGGSLAVVLTGAAVVGYLWWAGGRVMAARAEVCAGFVSLSPRVDVRIRTIHVQPGQRVRTGQPLVDLDDSEARAALEAALAGQVMAESRHAQARATAERTEARVNADIEVARAGVAIAAANVASARALLEYRRARVPEQIKRARAERDAARATLERLKRGPRSEEIETAKVKLATSKSLAELYTLELEQAESLVKEGLESLDVLQTKRARLTAQQGTTREAELTLSRLQAGASPEEIETAQQNLAAREAALAVATADARALDGLAADVAVREAELSRAREEVKRVEAARTEITVALEQVKAAAAELKQTEATVAGRRAALAAMTILSPVDGTVIRTFCRAGEFCGKGTTIVLVADDSAGRWLEAYVREEDAQRVKVGQTADVELGDGSAVSATVDAVALSASPLAGANPGQGSTGAAPSAAALVWVKLKPVEPMGDPLPGMSAYVVIHVR